MEYFGTTIKETIKALGKSPHLGKRSESDRSDKQKTIVRIIVTLVLCGIGIYLIVIPKKLTEGISLLTLVSGYWLR